METVAALVGFRSAHALRHHFRIRLGLRPSDYRARFIIDPAPTSSQVHTDPN
jgi:transcriptional regulator GlxA family with amidase domain